MSTIAVTGGGGMIGRHLVDALRPTGCRLRVMLMQNEPVPANFDSVEIERGDIRNHQDLANLLHGADTVFHLAAMVGRDANAAQLALVREVNVKGTKNVIEEAKRQGSRLVFLSTCCVYGLYGRADEIINERSPAAPLSLPYDLSKNEAEQLLMSEDPNHLAWSILEVPVALGGEHTISKPTLLSMIALAKLRLVPVPYSGPSWVNYVFGRDVADALLLLAHHPNALGEKFIFSESQPLSQFLALIADRMGRQLTPLPVPKVALDLASRLHQAGAVLANRRRFSAEKIATKLGFAATVGLSSGLDRTLSHYRKIGLLTFSNPPR